jgi:pyruvate dehydrogenase E2 component (dihydrolipoamide acetyltransferase)
MDGEPLSEGAECVFRLPDLGEGLVSGEIIDWFVEVGDKVEVDQPVVVVETEKATTELPIPYAGMVIRRHGEVRDRVAVNAPLVTIRVISEVGGAATAVTHLVGQRAVSVADDAGPAQVRRLPPKPAESRVVVSPAVRRLARELRVELRGLRGTGKGGAVTADDVRAAGERADGRAQGEAFRG